MIEAEVIGGEAADRTLQEFPPSVNRVLVRGLNRGIQSGRTFMASSMARDTGLKVGDVRNAISLKKANFASPEARIGASLKRIPLMKFDARGPNPSRGRGRVTYRVGRGRGSVAGAFITTMRSGHVGVFKRVGPGRLPVQELRGPSLGRVFGKFRAAGMARAAEMLTRTVEHELQRAETRNAPGTE